MHFLLTGAAGFIGSHIADAALAAGHELTVLDSLLPDVHPANPYSWPAYVPAEDRVRRIIG
ncbi:MAG: NAD-dependent epimerase/dehydratase family protein, partial [Antricoccus sp.]